jgi:hypothetical protein
MLETNHAAKRRKSLSKKLFLQLPETFYVPVNGLSMDGKVKYAKGVDDEKRSIILEFCGRPGPLPVWFRQLCHLQQIA